MENNLFICDCHSVEHQLLFSYDEEWDRVFVQVHLTKERSIWNRIVYGVKYIFGYQCRYGSFEEFIMKPDDADKLQEVVDYLRIAKLKKEIK